MQVNIRHSKSLNQYACEIQYSVGSQLDFCLVLTLLIFTLYATPKMGMPDNSVLGLLHGILDFQMISTEQRFNDKKNQLFAKFISRKFRAQLETLN